MYIYLVLVIFTFSGSLPSRLSLRMPRAAAPSLVLLLILLLILLAAAVVVDVVDVVEGLVLEEEEEMLGELLGLEPSPSPLL